jgi:hypothetical protein
MDFTKIILARRISEFVKMPIDKVLLLKKTDIDLPNKKIIVNSEEFTIDDDSIWLMLIQHSNLNPNNSYLFYYE